MRKFLSITCALILGTSFSVWFIALNTYHPSAEVTVVETALRSPDHSIQKNSKTVALPDDWVGEDNLSSVQWYRIRLPNHVKEIPLVGIFIPALEMTPALYLNGNFVAGDKTLDDPLPRHWNRPTYLSLPKEALQNDSNHVDIRLAANGQWGRLGKIYIGPHEILSKDYQGLFTLRVTLAQFIQIFCALMGSSIFILFCMRRETIFLAFSIFAFSWSSLNYLVTTVHFEVANRILDWAIYSSAGLLLASYSVFTLRLLEVRWPTWEKWLSTVAALGIIILYLTSRYEDVRVFNDMGSTLWMGALTLLSIVPFWKVMQSIISEFSWQSFALLLSYTIGFIFAAWDWSVVSGLGYRHTGLFLHYAAIPILLSYGIMLSRRFTSALDQRDELNADLEGRVQLKSDELEQAYLDNKKLRESTIVAEERERIMRDMHDGVGGHLISALSQLKTNHAKQDTAANDVEAALTDLRLMIDSSDPIDGNIVVALGLFRNRMTPRFEQAGIELDWQVEDLPLIEDLGPERLLHFYRILQECFTNAIKHSQATTLTVKTFDSKIIQAQECFGVIVSDNGIGISGDVKYGRGLTNMAYRAEHAHFKLIVKASDNAFSGTQITIGFRR